jgi:hypothetical protein
MRRLALSTPVWNHCNGAQRHALKRNQCFPNKATLQHSTNMLRYKAISRAAAFVDTPEHLSTQACCACGGIGDPKGTKGLEIREWTCHDCGAVDDRDVNAGRNILRLGRQALAEGSSIRTL